MRYFESRERGVIVVALGPDEPLLESIRQVARDAAIHTGVLMTGLGSLRCGRIHSVASNDWPPQDVYLDLPGPLEMAGFFGIIAGYEPHIHITLGDAQGKFYGGHLEEGCRTLTLAEISIMRLPDLKLTRRSPDGGPIKLLDLE